MKEPQPTPKACISRRPLLTGLLAALGAQALPAWSNETYPARAVKIIAPFSPGQGVDLLARALAVELQKTTKQSFIVDNRPGGGTVLGTSAAATAAPDGYTLLAVGNSFAINPSLHAKLPYNSQQDFAPVSLLASTPHVLVAKPQLAASSLAEIIAAAKAHPGEMNFASSGNGTAPHLAGEAFNKAAQTRIAHVPYKGQGPTVTALMAGEVDLMFANLLDVLPYIQSQKMKAIALSSAKRDPLLPQLPTMGEAGLPGFESSSWYGVMVRSGTPPSTIERLNALLTAALESPEIAKQYAGKGLNLTPSSPEKFAAFLKTEHRKYADIIQFANIRID